MDTADNTIIVRADYTNPAHCDAIPFLLNDYARGLLGFRRDLDASVRQGLVAGLQAMPTAIVLLAQCGHEFAGIAIAFEGFSTFKARPLINIHDIGVRALYRGKGIGHALMSEIEVIARTTGCCKITLEVQEHNAKARSFYAGLGFKESFLDAEAGAQLFLTREL